MRESGTREAMRRLAAAALVLAAASIQPARAAIDYRRVPAINDIAAHPTASGNLLLATRSGLFVATPDGRITPLALGGKNLTALSRASDASQTVFASGVDPDRKPLGVLRSDDGGRTWKSLSPGASGPAMYRALGIGASAAQTIYASYGGVQRSTDGGVSFEIVSRGPWDLFNLAVSTAVAERVYAASRGGLFASDDKGHRWRLAYEAPSAALALATRGSGEVYVFVAGRGLLRAREPQMEWETLSNHFGEQMLLKIAFAPGEAQRVYALNQFGRVLESADAGRSWRAFGGARGPTTPAGQRGQELYTRLCQQCHGAEGIGEDTTDAILSDPNYLRAPMLDDSTHAWHHSDDDLVKTILEGSPRAPRMAAFKSVISESEARDLVTYIKSLWGPKALQCQGERHMSKECRR